MGSDEVAVERDARVLTITLDRPADQNRLTRDVLLRLQSIVDGLAGDEEVQAVVVTGRGTEFFSMGILNPAVRASYSKDQILELVRMGNRLFDAIEALPQIVIAALNGATRAGAAELALELICTGREVDAAEMERLGLALALYPADRVLPAARALSDALRHALEWSRDVDEGMAAHREGRPPRFIGR